MRFLRAPAELDNIVADLGFSARVHFFCNFFKKFHSSSKNLILNFGVFELNDSLVVLCYF